MDPGMFVAETKPNADQSLDLIGFRPDLGELQCRGIRALI